MNNQKYLAATKKIMQKIATKGRHQITVLNRKFTVLPDVYSPACFSLSDTDFYTKELYKLLPVNSFLEIGSGSGATAVMMALEGVKKVVAVDINPLAVKNTQLNMKKYKVEDQVDIRMGDIFTALYTDEKFDLIFWNIPWWETEKEVSGWLDVAVFDPGSELLKRFIKEAKHWLIKNGCVALGYYSVKDYPSKAEDLFKKYGYTFSVIKSSNFEQEKGCHTSAVCDFIVASLNKS